MHVPLLTGLSNIAEDYDVFLIDAWGVLHDGETLYQGVLETLRQLKHAGKRVVLISNSSKRNSTIEAHLASLGIPDGYIEHVITSGEVTYHALRTGRFGEVGFFVGSKQGRSLLNDPGLKQTAQIEEADFILIATVSDDINYEPVLEQAHALKLPLICANPDVVVIHAAKRKICPGALAARYTELGGKVYLYGKPHAPIYEAAMNVLNHIPKSKIVAIGDAFPTDISGASAAGIDSILVTGGIHNEALGNSPSQDAINEMALENDLYPVAALPQLLW